MTFYETLVEATQEQRNALYSVPQLVAALTGDINRDAYIAYLTQAYHHVKHTVPFLMSMGARLPEINAWLRPVLAEYIEEEMGHEEWILNDIEAAGGSKDDARLARPYLSTEILVAYNYDYIARKNPVGFFGMVFMLESTSVGIATAGADSVKAALNLPKEAFSYLYSHGALDAAHLDFFKNNVNRIVDPADQAAIIEVAQNTFQLFAQMMRSIPFIPNRENPAMQLKGSTVLLTGGTGGLGAALRARLTQQGATVISAGRDEGEDIRVDLSNAEEVSFLCQQLAHKPIDIVIHNAGLQYFGRMHEQPEALLKSMVAVNLLTPLLLTRALLPGMLARGRGQVVIIGSAFAAIPFSHFGTYCATKGGTRAFSQSLRREYAGLGIIVTYVAPRAMRTAMSTGPIAEFLKRTKSATDDPALTAEKVVQAIKADRRDMTIGFSESIFSRLSALFPSLFDIALSNHRNIAEGILPPANH